MCNWYFRVVSLHSKAKKMKNKYAFLLLVASLFMVFQSCRKDGQRNQLNAVSLNATVNAGETYQLNLSQYGDADDIASITQQAVSYKVSEINKDAVTGNYIYKFSKAGSPKSGGNGTEKVVLKINEPEGRGCHHSETDITINFTIL